VYGRCATFASKGVSAFRALTEHDKRVLLSRNLDAMASVRMAAAFYPSDEFAVSDLSRGEGVPTPQPLYVEQVCTIVAKFIISWYFKVVNYSKLRKV
jgi:hypothetical protein